MTARSSNYAKSIARSVVALVLGFPGGSASAAPTDINDIPMAVSNQVQANFLVVLDNSQSMDAFMGGAMQSGDNPLTRGNIGRQTLREMLADYRQTFRWGLMTFNAPNPASYSIHAYYLGSDTSMLFTDDCVNGISASHGGLHCIANPQGFPGGNFLTYDKSSDDPSILDAFYSQSTADVIWAFSPGGGSAGSSAYDLWFTHIPGSGTAWALSEFANRWGTLTFSPTDAGFLPVYPTVSRQFYRYRGWGYAASITGGGRLWEPVADDSTTHYGRLISALGAETRGNTAEIKNAALYTPIAGTLESAKDYFSGQTDWRSSADYQSPIIGACQKNFVMLLTDGLPTGTRSGGLYSESARSDSCSQWSPDNQTCTGSWTFGQAANDSFSAVSALRSVPYTGCSDCSTFDVQIYVIAMGDNVANARAVALMNRMAELGGSKTAFFAQDANSLKSSIDAAVSDAVSKSGAAAAVAVANANITETTAAYQSSYESRYWTGDLRSYLLDVRTGTPLTDTPLWSAQEMLDSRVASSRKIASYDGSNRGVRFQPSDGTATTLSSGQQASISASDGAGIIAYLRGDRSGEQASATVAQKYRSRLHLLGDIVNAEPVLLAAPGAHFIEASNPGYAAFKAARASRQALVFQGANDGMLHAFNAATGAEEWAYVPSLLLAHLANLSSVSGFTHRYYVDGTPTVADVDFGRTAGMASGADPDWRTLLVGGLGKGGYGYYALDVTAGAVGNEASVAEKVLWEFPNSATDGQVVANIGYSFGRPIITKTADQGWVVLLTSGYNNSRTVSVAGVNYTGDGAGHLFVLNARTGELISDISTGAGSTDTPSGLAAFSGYLDNADADNTVTQVYAGDLLGNVWRFGLTGAASTWNVKRLATLVDDSGQAQAVTTAPELATVFEVNAAYRFIYVGTGRYLGDSDVTSTATQTMYGLVDDLSAAPTISPLRANLQRQTLSASASDSNQRTATRNTLELAGGGAKRGWYIDLPASGERVTTDPQLALGSLVFTSNIPSSVPCVPGGSSYLNILDYRTGGALDSSLLAWSSKLLGNALASRPVLVQLPSGELRALIRLSSDTTLAEGVPAPLAAPKIRRVSWRELPDTSK